MNVYEDKYLREKVNRIIARQKEGKIIIAAYKDGSGLPAREDLGQELTRAAYPYDYAVGKAGFLNYDSELGAYLFTAKSGEKLPQVLANYRILTLGEAILDVKDRSIHIQCGETSVTFTGAQPWKGLYEVLKEVNEELARVNSGIVFGRLFRRKAGIPNRVIVYFLKRYQSFGTGKQWHMPPAMPMTPITTWRILDW